MYSKAINSINEIENKMATSNPRVYLEVNFISFHDDDLPGTSITDPKNPGSFVVTTGGFPQEIIVQTRASSAKISRVSLTLNDAKDILLEKCCGETPGTFEVMAERTLARGTAAAGSTTTTTTRASGGGTQTEVFDIDPEGAGRDIRFLRLSILSGYSEFVAVYSIDAWGEESQQRIAVLQSKPEIVM
jgi:heat shock protein beta-11